MKMDELVIKEIRVQTLALLMQRMCSNDLSELDKGGVKEKAHRLYLAAQSAVDELG